MTPAQAVAAECVRLGPRVVVEKCRDILESRDVDVTFLVGLAGPHGENVVAGSEGGVTGYWPRVWAARALLYVWDERATTAIVAALHDESWRVREMALKVLRRHRVDAGLDAALAARDDAVPRVRVAAERAVVALTS